VAALELPGGTETGCGAAALQITFLAFPVNSREGAPMTEPGTRYQKYLARKRQKQEKKTTQTKAGKAGSMASQTALAANAPSMNV
jgi:hypothetical protein